MYVFDNTIRKQTCDTVFSFTYCMHKYKVSLKFFCAMSFWLMFGWTCKDDLI